MVAKKRLLAWDPRRAWPLLAPIDNPRDVTPGGRSPDGPGGRDARRFLPRGGSPARWLRFSSSRRSGPFAWSDPHVGSGKRPRVHIDAPRVELSAGPGLATCSMRRRPQKSAMESGPVKRQKKKKKLLKRGSGRHELGMGRDRGCEGATGGCPCETRGAAERREERQIRRAGPPRRTISFFFFSSLVSLKVGKAAR